MLTKCLVWIRTATSSLQANSSLCGMFLLKQKNKKNSKQKKQKHMICVDLCLCKCMVVSELCNFAMSEIRFIGIYTDSSMGKILYLRVLFVCLFVCLFVFWQPGDHRERLTTKEESLTIGHSVTFHCDLDSDTDVGWYDENGEDISVGSDARVSVVGTNKLRIKDVRPSDGGTYKCRGKNKKRFYVMYVTCK